MRRAPIEAARAATLLLRGFTFWLPMLPGVWLARIELRASRRKAASASGSGAAGTGTSGSGTTSGSGISESGTSETRIAAPPLRDDGRAR